MDEEFKEKEYEYKLKKGSLSCIWLEELGRFFMFIDSLDLPLDDILKNYGFTLDEEIHKQLKELGY